MQRTILYLFITFEVKTANVLCERIHMKYQVLFSLKNNEQVFTNVACCSRD